MAGTYDGARKTAALRTGCTPAEYDANLAAGMRWCWSCGWALADEFGTDLSRADGWSRVCRPCKNTRARERYAARGRR